MKTSLGGSRGRRGPEGIVAGILLLAAAGPSLGVAQEAQGGQGGTHVVKEGDTLWDLSNEYLGSSYEWPKLWSYNPEITNPHWIYPGHVLRLREGAEPDAAVAGAASGGTAEGFFSKRAGSPRVDRGLVRVGEEVYLDRDALAQAARIVGSPEDHFMLSPTDEVYLKFNRAAPLAGADMTVFVRFARDEVKPTAGKVKVYPAGTDGEVVRVVGALKIIDHDPRKKIARAVITEAIEPIERGFEVTDVPRSLAQVMPKTNRRGLDAKIVAAAHPLGTLGQNQIVFINAGSKQGVEVGNRFVVLRQGDTWRKELTLDEEYSGASRPDPDPTPNDAFPPAAVGEARVLFVRPESCTALITETLVELNPGDRVRLPEGY